MTLLEKLKSAMNSLGKKALHYGSAGLLGILPFVSGCGGGGGGGNKAPVITLEPASYPIQVDEGQYLEIMVYVTDDGGLSQVNCSRYSSPVAVGSSFGFVESDWANNRNVYSLEWTPDNTQGGSPYNSYTITFEAIDSDDAVASIDAEVQVIDTLP